MASDERFLTVDLSAAYNHTRTRRTRRAVQILRRSVARHFKAATDDVRLSEKLNEALWIRSMEHPPRRIKVRVEKKDGRVSARLHDEKVAEKKPEEKKAAKPEVKAVPTPEARKAEQDRAAETKEKAAPKPVPPSAHKHESEKALEHEKKREETPHQHGEYGKVKK